MHAIFVLEASAYGSVPTIIYKPLFHSIMDNKKLLGPVEEAWQRMLHESTMEGACNT